MATTQPAGRKKIKVPKVVNGIETEVEVEVDDAAGPAWGANDQHRLLNKPLRRADGPVKASGTAIYTYDVRLPGMVHGRLLCSPHAHANVTKFDSTAAQKIKGVLAVLPANRKEVRFEGDPIAAVAAATPEIAEDALRAIVVEYEVLPHLVKAADALKPDAPKVFHDAGKLDTQGKAGPVADAMAACDATIDAEYSTSIIHHCCLETHGVTVDYRGGDSATVYASTQGTFTIPGDAAKALGLVQSKVTSIVQHMGGGFGSKFGIGAEGQWACRLSRQLGLPVKMMLPRRDEFLLAGNGHGSLQKLKGGANRDGTLVAIHAVQYRLGGVGGGSLAGQPYQYQAQHVYREISSLHTNEGSACAMRAPGHPPASFAIESLLDELAYKLGIDPIDIRKKNAPDEIWHRQLDRGAREIGWANRNPKPGEGAGPLRRGMGCAIGAWGGGGGPSCKVDVTISRDGAVIAAVGSQDLGTGTRTYVRAIVAEELGLEPRDVQEKIGDSSLGNANASGGSTTTPSLAPAVKDAAFNARVELAKLVAPLLGAAANEVIFTDGRVAGNGKAGASWKQACAAVPAAGLSVRGEWKDGLSTHGAHGACFAEVEVDIQTGHIRPVKMVHVQDGGLPLNRLAYESQINGGMIQGLGMALYEGRVMDSQLGVMLNAGLGDYKLPGCLEMPELVPIIDDDDKRNAVIGIAEPAVIPACAAVANAVFNACGVRVRDLPITPDKILNGLMTSRKG